MPRQKRIDIKGYFYHIIARGQRKNPIFFSDYDFNKFLYFTKLSLNKTDIELYAYCLMRNHYHLLIKRNFISLGKFMSILQTNYAIYFNNKYNLAGHVFQGRYKSFIILDEKYLNALINYIHNNPVKNGLIKNSENYNFSSAKYYNNKEPYPNFLKIINSYKHDYIDIEDFINNELNYIGTEINYLLLNNRHNKRKNNIYNDYIKICEKYKISLLIRKNFKNSPKLRNNIKTIVTFLLLKGYTKTEIAKFFSCSRITIHRIVNK